jgi:O-acetyl-ADP-ribose deacetylase (regulator of RNase III)
MLIYNNSTVFNVGAQTIVNTVNCVGVMGAGIALEFKLRYPEMYADYSKRCQQKEVKVGYPYLYHTASEWILNFPTKHHWKYPSKIQWIHQGLNHFAATYEAQGVCSVAFPKLGCSNGNLEWQEVKPLMEDILGRLDIDVHICLDVEPKATGVEGQMVEMLNNLNDPSSLSEIGVRSSTAAKIASALPISHFREIGGIKGVGEQAYGTLFRILYEKVWDDQKLGAELPIRKQQSGGEIKQLGLEL